MDHLRGARELNPAGHRLHYSVITRAELFAGSAATDLVSTLLSPFREVPVDRDIAERAGRIRRETGLRMPDALIAATAVEHRLGLATRTRRRFDKVRACVCAPFPESLDARASLRVIPQGIPAKASQEPVQQRP